MIYFFISLLSYIWPGFGHFYIKKVHLGLAFSIAFIVIYILFFQFLCSNFIGFTACYVVLIIVRIFSIFSAIINYNKNRILLKKIYGVILFVFSILFMYFYKSGEFTRFRSNTIASSVMANTLIKGDKVMSDYNGDYGNNIQHGDIVVYKFNDHYSVSRVIALENDIIEIIDDVVYINGEPIVEEYKNLDQNELNKIRELNSFDQINNDLVSTKIKNNYVFLLGDNRYNSRDSRFIGQISRNNIYGKILYIYLSKNIKKIGKKIK